MSVFNVHNNEWRSGEYSLFLGEEPALHDSVNRPYPQLFEKYKLQKSIDWSEDEINLEQSRMDLQTCSKNNYDIMLKNLAFQWELDSIASRSITPLFAPFVTNSELWAWYSKCAEMEVLHSLTYSEIIRQCIPDPQEAISEVMENNKVIARSQKVAEVFNELQRVGAMYTLGLLNKTDVQVKNAVVKGVVALYCLERIEFMSSFAATFSLGEQGMFQGICKLVQKICQDECVHYQAGEDVIKILKKSPLGVTMKLIENELQEIIDEVVKQELSWNEYLFSEGRSVVGLNKSLLDEWVRFNAQDAYSVLGLVNPYGVVAENPLPWMENWIDINKNQNANQEADNNNYTLNTVIDDVGEEELDFDF